MAFMVLLLGASCRTAILPRAPEPPPEPKRFGTVWIVPDTSELIVSGYVNQVAGMLELFACGPRGKVHETSFVLFAKTQDLQAGLLLLGLRHGSPMPGLGQGPPQGDAVNIRVEWEEDGRTVTRPAEDFLYDVQREKPARHGAWIFNGSTMEDGRLKAEVEDSMIATYWDPWAIINMAADLGADDERIAVNRETIPPMHTPIRMVITPAGRRTP